LAQYDLDTAQTMHVGGRWHYVAFMCQQAIEKLCKGIYNYYIGDAIPRVHNIRFILAKIETSVSVSVKPEVYELIDTLSAHYLNNRYPDFSGQLNAGIDENKATDLLEKTREVFSWLLTLKK